VEATTIMAIVAAVLLVLHWKGPNAVWGGATLGIIAGVIVALVTKDWGWLATIFALATYAGTFFEWLGRLSKRLSRR
jgi:hypothetical protein